MHTNFASKTIEDCKNFIRNNQFFTNDVNLAIASDDDEYIIKSRVEVKKTKEQIAKERVIIDRYVLRSKRKQLRIKADYIANRIGISVTRYREYENGYGNPTRAMARIMCDVLDLKFYELVIE